jgi:hypothetical protein
MGHAAYGGADIGEVLTMALNIRATLRAGTTSGARAPTGKAPDNRHRKGNERVLHRKTKQVTMAPSDASATVRRRLSSAPWLGLRR